MDKKTFALGVLSVSSMVLILANYFAPQPAQALLTIKDRDFAMVTARTQQSGDALYVLDNRSGKVGVFAYDASTKSLVPRGIAEASVLFTGQ